MTAGTTWLNGAFTKVAKAGQIAGTKTREKFHLAVSNLTAKVSSIYPLDPFILCYLLFTLILS